MVHDSGLATVTSMLALAQHKRRGTRSSNNKTSQSDFSTACQII